jgi:hypothetical protein
VALGSTERNASSNGRKERRIMQHLRSLTGGLALLAITALTAGCELVDGDVAVSGGEAVYVTFKKTPSAQLLIVKNLLCGGDGACVLDVMRAFKPTYCIVEILGRCIGQAEYDEVLHPKHAGDIAAAIDAVQSVNTPAACVRVKVWKTLPFLETRAKWYATNDNCHAGGNLWD